MSNAILYRMPYGIPGDVTRPSQSTIETQLLDSANPFGAYGLFGKISGGKFIPVGSGDLAAAVYGLLARPYPTHGANSSDPLGTAVPKTTGPADVLRRGYASVKVNAGTAAINGPVYVRTANASSGKPIGGIEAAKEWGSSSAAKSGGNTGNGTLVLDGTTPVLSNAVSGVYTVRCTVSGTHSATFEVRDPKGNDVGSVSFNGAGASATFANQIKFAVTDGATDFVVGDGFDATLVDNTIAVPGAAFMSAADAGGNAELAYNI